MFSTFKDAIAKFKAGIDAEVARFNNRDFLNAATALSARVAAADGTISDDEKQKMGAFLSMYPSLKVFSGTDVVASWGHIAGFYAFDKAMGDAEADKLISKVTDPDARATLVRLGCAIGAADGDFDDNEKAVVISVCRLLGLRAADFGL